MATLTTLPCAAVVARRFAEADASNVHLQECARSLSADELKAMMPSNPDYQTLYTNLKDFYLAVSRETATLLYMLARSCRATSMVEFGTSFGVSALHLAAALRDNGGGRLIGTEFEPAKVAQARENIAAAGLGDLVEIRAGDALQTLASDLPESIDLVLFDGAKGLYPRVLSLLESRLRPGALLVADNAGQAPAYLAQVRDSARGYLSIALSDDVELSMRT